MSEKREKPQQYVTPAGTFVWPRLGEPDTKFKDAGEYNVKLRLSAEEAQSLIEKLEPMHTKAIEEGHEAFAALPVANRKKLGKLTENPLYTLDYDEEENETGDLLFIFKSTASGVSKKTGKPWSRRPGVFDAKRKPIAGASVWGGTIGKIAFTTAPYFVKATGAAGLSLRLEAVQVLELVSGGERSGASYGFGEEDGYEGVETDDAADHDSTDDSGGDF